MPSTADEQIQFIVSLQRLLDEGAFVASYKYARLLALADLSFEFGGESGDTLTLTTSQIAEEFIGYYSRQAVPYAALPTPASCDRALADRPLFST
jgi:hypothetical protein